MADLVRHDVNQVGRNGNASNPFLREKRAHRHNVPTSYLTPLLFSLAAEAVFGAVEEALDVRLVLHDDKHSDNHCKNHLSEVHAFKIVFRAYVTENRKNAEKRTPENTANRNVLCRKREDYPEGKCREHRERQNREEHAKCG